MTNSAVTGEESVKRRCFRYYVETYGCQMNVSDTEVVHSLLQAAGHQHTPNLDEASLILLNTCAIRDHAERKIWDRLRQLRAVRRGHNKQHQVQRREVELHQHDGQQESIEGVQSNGDEGGNLISERMMPLIALLGCMAERLKENLLTGTQPLVDIVAGPDAYRDLPRLIQLADCHETAINTSLSLYETYENVSPIRRQEQHVYAYVSIQRGCDAYCSYCVVPQTRGHERSRNSQSIIEEVQRLSECGFKEITLLGQNVNSYAIKRADGKRARTRDALAQGFSHTSRPPLSVYNFEDLLDEVSRVDPEMRIRFVSPHPKDFSDSLLDLIAERPNVCKSLHMPAQSGSSSTLTRMRRGYSREAYLGLIERATQKLGAACCISTDLIAGFCGETEEEHAETLSLIETVHYDAAFTFAYSQREKTHAHRTMPDDVPQPIKQRRLQELIDAFHKFSKRRQQALVDSQQLVLVDGPSKRGISRLCGRTDGNKQVTFDSVPIPDLLQPSLPSRVPRAGDYVVVVVESATAVSLVGQVVSITSLQQFARSRPNFAKIIPNLNLSLASRATHYFQESALSHMSLSPESFPNNASQTCI